ncbi:MAG: DUF4402 domain-containing protein [Novosphingobium sp.]|jgi:hypothetical protein|uniref:DUF4402 domain-containing protein n=1 Tax=Novosphingobium sp. TaxID=1874826 RepID=UPI00391C061F|nr:DUF4402 domain-containing protein [Novosphingobium sp.]
MHVRRFRTDLAIVLTAICSAAAIPARAEPERVSARASVEVLAPLSVMVAQTLSFGRLQVQGGSGPAYVTIDPAGAVLRRCVGVACLPGSEAAMVAIIRGEPNRSYRITLPASAVATPGSFKVSGLTIISATRGNVAVNGYGRLNVNGVEEVRIGGTLLLNKTARLGVYTANIPIAVLYE